MTAGPAGSSLLIRQHKLCGLRTMSRTRLFCRVNRSRKPFVRFPESWKKGCFPVAVISGCYWKAIGVTTGIGG